jgi:hypothetical protein
MSTFESVICSACGTEQTTDQVVGNNGCIECNEPLCLFCGCTEFNPCPEGCSWVLPFICSADLHCVLKEIILTFGGDAGRETAGVLRARAIGL